MMQPEVLSPDDSTFWRQAYLDAFVNTPGEHYRTWVGALRQFSDGAHYEGYLWDCLRSASRITFERLRQEVVQHPEVFVMADDHSRERVIDRILWPYPALSVARFQPEALLNALTSLPEDLYVFDSTVSWTLVLTHEHDAKRRMCLTSRSG